jgi:hypothetical protein
MRFARITFALALLTLSAAASDKKGAALPSSTSVLINGQAIKGKVLEMDGKHFVAVEDLAQSLRGSIAYGDGQIALTLSQLPSTPTSTPTPPPSPSPSPTTSAVPIGTGRVTGTLTYFFSVRAGSKPDNGSKVWLVQGRAEIPADQNFTGSSVAVGTSANPEQYRAIKYAVADENGNFELLEVPAGEYTLVLQSAHTKGTLNEKRDFFGRGNGRNPRDTNGRVVFLNLLVKPGETVDTSKDFGPNIDM